MRIILTTLFLAFLSPVFGQDLIVRTNGDTIKSYISEVGKDEIRYRKVDDRKEPVYTIKKTLVDKVVYENGEVDNFELTKKDKEAATYDFKHRVSWVYTDVFIARFSVAYEYVTPKGYIGIRVPLSIGVSPFSNVNGTGASANGPGLTYLSGVDLHIYPTTARGDVKYFFGPQIRVGHSSSDLWEGLRNTFGTVTFVNGLSVNIIPQLNMSAYLGIGVKYSHYPKYENYYDPNTGSYVTNSYNAIYPHATFGMTVGYNFGGGK
jgi:hypothetical protein